MKVYCPKCGEPMSVQHDGQRLASAECRAGNMPLSIKLAEILDRDFLAADAPSEPDVPLMAESPWYCPRDGSVLWQSGQLRYTCPDCGRHLGAEAVRHLTEFHPHE